MAAHAERGDRVFFRGPPTGVRGAQTLGWALSAAGLWRAQRELRHRRAGATAGAGGEDPRVLALRTQVRAAQEALGGPVFCVPIARFAEREIGRLARRAHRLGAAPISLRDTGERASGRAFVVLIGEPSVLAGWELAAIVEHRGHRATLSAVTPVGEGLDPGCFAESRCEHCALRRQRVRTFVLLERSSGELRQVGTACLRDFLGGHNPELLCRAAEYLSRARRTVGRVEAVASERGEPPLEELAAHAAHAVRAHG